MGVLVPMKVLFETPSGFALFVINGGLVTGENTLEIIWPIFVNRDTSDLTEWLVEFQKVENKLITPGIDERVVKMIKKWYVGETLLVGKPEHKVAIEKELKIPCQCDEAAMEVMWGVENLLHILVPNEEIQLKDEDRKLRSQGLHMFLQSLDYNIEKELANGQIAETACYIYHCLRINKQLLKCLHKLDYLQKEGIDTQDWGALKYATAILIMRTDEPSSGPCQVFSEEEEQKINGGKGKQYDLIKDNFMTIYKKTVHVNQTKVKKLKELDALVKEAQGRSGRAGKLREELDESESNAKKRKRVEA